jgi:hypothetical protein
MTTLFYKPWSILFGIAGGLVASRLFAALWSLVNDEPPPKPTQRDTTWKAVIPAAALEGAIYAGVKAAAQRGSATSFEHTTGVWPGKEPKKR